MKNEEQKIRYEKWQAIIDEQEGSGQSQAVFCKQRNISAAQLGYYRSILKPKNAISTGIFTSIAMAPSAIAKDVRVILPNGFQCTFPSDLNALAIKELIKALLLC
jgi:hypothetical protein